MIYVATKNEIFVHMDFFIVDICKFMSSKTRKGSLNFQAPFWVIS